MSWYKAAINRIIKAHDRELFCHEMRPDVLAVFRKKKRFVPVLESDEAYFYHLISDRELVLPITDTFTARGRPRVWGLDVILSELKYRDLAQNPEFFQALEEEDKKHEEAKKRHLRSEAEAFFSDTRSHFKKAWSDVRTALMSKDEPRKRIKEKSIHGNH